MVADRNSTAFCVRRASPHRFRQRSRQARDVQDPPENDEAETGGTTPFMWGVTSSSVQSEGVHPAADWSHWERDKTAPESSDGNGFATNFHDDLALIASLGVTDVRLTIEWARVEPVEG